MPSSLSPFAESMCIAAAADRGKERRFFKSRRPAARTCFFSFFILVYLKEATRHDNRGTASERALGSRLQREKWKASQSVSQPAAPTNPSKHPHCRAAPSVARQPRSRAHSTAPPQQPAPHTPPSLMFVEVLTAAALHAANSKLEGPGALDFRPAPHLAHLEYLQPAQPSPSDGDDTDNPAMVPGGYHHLVALHHQHLQHLQQQHHHHHSAVLQQVKDEFGDHHQTQHSPPHSNGVMSGGGGSTHSRASTPATGPQQVPSPGVDSPPQQAREPKVQPRPIFCLPFLWVTRGVTKKCTPIIILIIWVNVPDWVKCYTIRCGNIRKSLRWHWGVQTITVVFFWGNLKGNYY